MSRFSKLDRVKHLKTGTVYLIVDVPENVTIERDHVPAYAYRAVDSNRVWIRPAVEMEDGRFEKHAMPDCICKGFYRPPNCPVHGQGIDRSKCRDGA